MSYPVGVRSLALALTLALTAGAAAATGAGADAPPPSLSRAQWDKAVQHAQRLHDAVKAHIAQLDLTELKPGAPLEAPGGKRRAERQAALRRDPARVAVPTPAGRAQEPQPVPQLDGGGALPAAAQPLTPRSAGAGPAGPAEAASAVLALPSLEESMAPLAPDALAPESCAALRLRDGSSAEAKRLGCPAPRGI
jgi:hypothetical protein